jgi:signal transduction histidine kinase
MRRPRLHRYWGAAASQGALHNWRGSEWAYGVVTVKERQPTPHDESQRLANELFEIQSKLRAAGRGLHDQIGPLLTAAGLRLELLRSDYPETAPSLKPVLVVLEEAMDRVRAMSREFNPSPATHLGLKKALSNLVDGQQESFAGEIQFSYSATATLSHDSIAAIYEAAKAVLARAVSDPSASRIAIVVRGSRGLRVAIGSNGPGVRWPRAELAALNRRARPAGVSFKEITLKSAIVSKKGTIVSILYAPRRPSRG